ncbi:hypothetical protein Calag_0440 [Caldisphaera lagunensis DSM 15908]|uniref:Uncharacterized protein n=1 Tax=Caldisphaera lagunensis (strain DSM 15908 / JCM 11604 / ANMR 0165 / IC-154) TaxID=1056495 RepID=L0A8L3_CALLD|nr:hypothetical protein [Caldisphaera lagunensis]AFZ70208.1 hypothetical protein Calag_0440 [Caldisphaera lagunensis DSM 15908]
MSSVDEIKNIDNLILPLGQLSDSEAENLISEIVNLLSIAGNQNADIKVQFSTYAGMIYDELITKINLRLYAQKALKVIGYPLADSVELIDCLGESAIKELLLSAAKILSNENAEFDQEVLDIYSDCLGWDKKPSELDKETISIAIFVSFTGALNKWLNSLGTA